MGIVRRDSIIIAVIAYAGAAIGYLNKLFLFTNFLTTEQVGLANLLVTIATLYAQFSALGSFNIISRYFPYFSSKQKHHHGFLFGVTALSLAGFVLATILFLVFWNPIADYYRESSPLLVEFLPYLIPLSLAILYYSVFEAYLRSLYKNIVSNLTYEILLRLFITLTITLYALDVVDFQTFVTIYVAAHCLPSIIIIAYTLYLKQLLIRPIFSTNWKRLGMIVLVYGLYSMLNNFSSLLINSIDSLMVARMIDLGAAGIYTTMIFVTSIMLIPYRSMTRVSTPLVAEYWKERAIARIASIYERATTSNLVIGAGLFLLLWINIDNLFSFMPDEYSLGKTVFLYLGIARLFDMASGLNGVILITSKKYRWDILFTLGMVVMTILTNYWFIKMLGMTGAAMASMITIITYNLLRVIFVYYHFSIQPFRLKHIWVVVMLLAGTALSAVLRPATTPVIDIFIRSCVVGLFFSIPLYLLKVSPDLNQMVEKYARMAWQVLGTRQNTGKSD